MAREITVTRERTLILNVVLFTLTMYYMSFFRLAIWVKAGIDKIRKNFSGRVKARQ